MLLTYMLSSFDGLVSSNLKFVFPLNVLANSKLITIALACPMCKKPFGSGGKRVTISLCFFCSISFSIIVFIKFEDISSIIVSPF